MLWSWNKEMFMFRLKWKWQLWLRKVKQFILPNFHPLGATALSEPWPPQQTVSIALYFSSSPSTALSSLLSRLLQHYPSISREVFLFFFLPSFFSTSLPLAFSLHIPAILSFYKFHNILSVYGSIQFFIISNSPSIPLGSAQRSFAVFSFRKSLTNSHQIL